MISFGLVLILISTLLSGVASFFSLHDVLAEYVFPISAVSLGFAVLAIIFLIGEIVIKYVSRKIKKMIENEVDKQLDNIDFYIDEDDEDDYCNCCDYCDCDCDCDLDFMIYLLNITTSSNQEQEQEKTVNERSNTDINLDYILKDLSKELDSDILIVYNK